MSRSYRVCRCGFEGITADDDCPICGTEWFITPETTEVSDE